jgi:hypothetical protein
MMTMDEILQAYDDGAITRNELFSDVLLQIAQFPPEALREALNREAGCWERFEEWVDDVAAGAAVFSGSRQMRISNDTRAAIMRLRDRTRAARYAKLAARMRQWITDPHEGEPVCTPDDMEPFQVTDIDRLLPEAA